MFRPSLADDRGMLFLFEIERVPSFWMKNTLIPLDLLFLGGDGTSRRDRRQRSALRGRAVSPVHPDPRGLGRARGHAGIAERHGLAVGDPIEFQRVPGYPK